MCVCVWFLTQGYVFIDLKATDRHLYERETLIGCLPCTALPGMEYACALTGSHLQSCCTGEHSNQLSHRARVTCMVFDNFVLNILSFLTYKIKLNGSPLQIFRNWVYKDLPAIALIKYLYSLDFDIQLLMQHPSLHGAAICLIIYESFQIWYC